MKDPEASWKGICSTSMKGPEPRPRTGWQKRTKIWEEAKKPKEPRKGWEKVQKPREGPEESPKKGWEDAQKPTPEVLEKARKSQSPQKAGSETTKGPKQVRPRKGLEEAARPTGNRSRSLEKDQNRLRPEKAGKTKGPERPRGSRKGPEEAPRPRKC